MSRPGRSVWAKIGAIGGTVVATVFLLNPTGGLVELIPDLLPFVGNLDEAAATGLLLYCLRTLFGGRARVGDSE